MSKLTILIPAAGASRRMQGKDKLLELVDGTPQLRRIVDAALETGSDVIVTLGQDHEARKAVLAHAETLKIVSVDDASEGMSASLRAGVHHAGDCDGLMIVPADMPELETSDFQKLTDRFSSDPSRIYRAASANGRPGHPVVLPKRVFPDISRLQGDHGGRDILKEEAVVLVPLEDERALTDLDTPEQWAAWRSGRK